MACEPLPEKQRAVGLEEAAFQSQNGKVLRAYTLSEFSPFFALKSTG
jgi:hypothetical protein